MEQTPETTGESRDELGRFVKGVSGNPEGRPKGSRNRLSEAFFTALADDFEKHGAQAIIDARTNNPGEYTRVIAGLQKQQQEVDGVVEVKAYGWQK